MDWSKAKTILIVSFIVVNIMLGISLIDRRDNTSTIANQELVEDSIRLLKNKDISVATDIPREIPSLKTLVVEYEVFKAHEVNKKFFDEKAKVSLKMEGLVEMEDGHEKLTILNNKHIIYESSKDSEDLSINSFEDAENIAKDFLRNLGYDTVDMKLSYIKEKDGRYSLEFSKLYNGKYLESAFTNIQLDKTGIKKLERLWLNIIEEGDVPIFISSAPKSILALLSINEAYGRTIKDISLCYYFDPEKHSYIQNPLEARQGRAIPAWRIQFEDGYKIFIDDY